MKRKFKRIASLVLAAVMVFAMAMPTMAATSITIDTKEKNHTYYVYQIFTGTVSGEAGSEVLADIAWGASVTKAGQTNFGDAREYAKTLTAANLQDFADDLMTGAGGVSYLATEPFEMIKYDETNGYKVDGLPEGYYMIIDAPGNLENDDIVNEAYTSYIIQVIGNVDMAPKSQVPSVDKEVSDDEDGITWGETADHEIGEVFQFKLDATLPGGSGNDNLKFYEKYKLVFHDTMSKGVTYVGNPVVKVKVGRTEYTLTSSTAGTGSGEDGITTLTVTIEDLLSATFEEAGALDAVKAAFGTQDIQVVVTYDAYLNGDAVVAKDGTAGTYNNNNVYLEYSNNPNAGGEGDTDTTPDDTVYVFTFNLPNQKVDEDETSGLAGAKFQLYSAAQEGVTEELGSGAPLDLIREGESYTYRFPTEEEKEAVPKPAGWTNEIVTADDGKFDIKGLDEGVYYLEETEAPAGRNKLDKRIKIKVEVEKQSEDEANGTATTVYQIEINGSGINDNNNVTGVYSEGTDKIVNKKGATLPETGGIGTTIFYVVGSVLVLGAVILLVTKRRMKG